MKPTIKTDDRRTLAPVGLCGFLLAVLLVMPVWVSAGIANEECSACHDAVGNAFAATPHGIYLSQSAAADNSCESCHGPGDAHVEAADPELIHNPAAHDQFGGKETCTSCHDGHQFDGWAFSEHRGAGVSCTDCHQIHVDAGKGSVANVSEMCYTCHSDVRAAAHMPSHHPIVEGKVSCLDCHNVHGGTVEMALDDTKRELCFSCHADKEGPFVYEHAPASEDCMMCHTPHGSVADNLLKQNEPALCLNCHAMHFHATVTSVDGDFTTPQAPDRASSSTPDGFKKAMLTKCTQCHTSIHGSDMPSQAISTGGNALTR